MSKHIDYVQQPDGTYKWELAEIPAVKSTPPAKVEKKKIYCEKNYYYNYYYNKRIIYGNRRKSNSA